ncbi:MAG: hypothetical protein HY875_01450 [Chloroflexi bacterium]|nr:hypothetical protein [Chloroflexota bacterium]
MARESSRPPVPLLLGGFFLVALAAAAGVLLLWANDSENTVLNLDRGYVEGVAGTWQRVNPLFAASNAVDADLSQLVFSGLSRLGPDGRVLPDLAEAPEISSDGRVYTFRLRKNLKWHDGQPLTSRDVAFTIAALTDPNFKGDPTLAEGWLGIEVATPDPQTVVFTLKQPSAPFLARNTTIGILPEHLLGSKTAAELFDAPFNAAPVGSGPYILESLDSTEAVLKASSNYYLGQPGVSSLRLRFYTDYPAAIRAIEDGAIDGILIRDALSEAQLTELKRLKGTVIDQPQRAAYLLLYLNNDLADTFQDERVRRAVSLAIDRQAIVDKSFRGLATPSSSAIAPGTWAYAKQFDAIAADRKTAAKLLDDAGWKAHPTTGILIRNGQEFRFTIRTDSDPLRMAVANEIARQLEPLGIRATVASTTFSVLWRDFLQERKYEAAIAGWDQGPDPDLYSGWHSSQMGAAGLNIANFADQVADGLIEKGRTTSDVEVRADFYGQLQDVWQEKAPSVVIAYPRYTYVHTTRIKGLSPEVLFAPSLRFSEVLKWKQ